MIGDLQCFNVLKTVQDAFFHFFSMLLNGSGRVISSCSTSSTHRITLIKTSVLGGGSEEEIGVMTIRQTEHIRGKL
jgi:hypothetical protein